MKFDKNIFLIRHTSLNIKPGICYGQSEVELSDRFIPEAENIKTHLPLLDDKIILSSPSLRCIRLAEYLFTKEIHIDKRILEYHFGEWELKLWDNILRKDFNHWMEHIIDTPCPGGESLNQMFQRVRSFWGEIIEHSAENIIIISHSGVIRCILADILKIPRQNMFSLRIDFASISYIKINNAIPEIRYINRV